MRHSKPDPSHVYDASDTQLVQSIPMPFRTHFEALFDIGFTKVQVWRGGYEIQCVKSLNADSVLSTEGEGPSQLTLAAMLIYGYRTVGFYNRAGKFGLTFDSSTRYSGTNDNWPTTWHGLSTSVINEIAWTHMDAVLKTLGEHPETWDEFPGEELVS